MNYIKYFENERSWSRIDRSKWYELRSQFKTIEFTQTEIDKIKDSLNPSLKLNMDSKVIGIYHRKKCFLSINKLENGKILVYDHLKMSKASKYSCRDIDGLIKWMNMNLNNININENFNKELLIKNSQKIQDKLSSLEKNIDNMINHLIKTGYKMSDKEMIEYLQKEKEKIDARWEEIKK